MQSLVLCVFRSIAQKREIHVKRYAYLIHVIHGEPAFGHFLHMLKQRGLRPRSALPVIAAGGIADGRGMAASMMLGACGVQLGTRFLSAEECTIHPTYKEKIVGAKDLCTMVTGKRLGHPVRSLRTQFARNYAQAEYSGMADEDLENLAVGALRLAVQEGDLEKGCFLSGQCAAMVRKVEPAAGIIRDVVEGAEKVLKGASAWVK